MYARVFPVTSVIDIGEEGHNYFIAGRHTKVVKLVTGNTRAYMKYNGHKYFIADRQTKLLFKAEHNSFSGSQDINDLIGCHLPYGFGRHIAPPYSHLDH